MQILGLQSRISKSFSQSREQFWKQNTNHLFFAGTKYFFDVGILLSEMGVCKLSNVDMLPAARQQNSVKLQWLNPILPSDSEYCNLRMVACDTTICDFEVSTIAMHSMTQLLSHTITHFTGSSFMSKHCQKLQNFDFQGQFSMSKNIRIFPNFFFH